jgi:hypothetical protein
VEADGGVGVAGAGLQSQPDGVAGVADVVALARTVGRPCCP